MACLGSAPNLLEEKQEMGNLNSKTVMCNEQNNGRESKNTGKAKQEVKKEMKWERIRKAEKKKSGEISNQKKQ